MAQPPLVLARGCASTEPPSTQQSTFHRLLTDLESEHAREINALLAEIEILKKGTQSQSYVESLQERAPTIGGSGPSLSPKKCDQVSCTESGELSHPVQAKDTLQHVSSDAIAETAAKGPSKAVSFNVDVQPSDYDVGKESSTTSDEISEHASKDKTLKARGKSYCLNLEAHEMTNEYKSAAELALEPVTAPSSVAQQASDIFGRIFDAMHMQAWHQQFEDWVKWWDTLEEPRRGSRLARFIGGNVFSCLCFVVIVSNAGFVVYTSNLDMDYALGPQVRSTQEQVLVEKQMMAINVFFTVFYTVEVALKLFVHRLYFFVNKDMGWNLSDTILVCLALADLRLYWTVVIDQEVDEGTNLVFLRILRVLKIAKVFRVIRAVRFVQDLRLMFECVLNTATQLVWSVALIVFVLYLFSLVFVQGLAGHTLNMARDDADLADLRHTFGSVSVGMISLFMATTGGVDWHEQYDLVSRAGDGFKLAYLFFIAFFVIAAWNIVTSTFVDKAFKLALPDLDFLVYEKHKADVKIAKELMHMVSELMDEDCDGMVSMDEFIKNINDPVVREFFAVRGLDLKDAQSFYHMLQSVDGQTDDRVDIRTFVGCALRLQGAASRLDVQTLHFDIKSMYTKQRARIHHLEKLIRLHGDSGHLQHVSSRPSITDAALEYDTHIAV